MIRHHVVHWAGVADVLRTGDEAPYSQCDRGLVYIDGDCIPGADVIGVGEVLVNPDGVLFLSVELFAVIDEWAGHFVGVFEVDGEQLVRSATFHRGGDDQRSVGMRHVLGIVDFIGERRTCGSHAHPRIGQVGLHRPSFEFVAHAVGRRQQS